MAGKFAVALLSCASMAGGAWAQLYSDDMIRQQRTLVEMSCRGDDDISCKMAKQNLDLLLQGNRDAANPPPASRDQADDGGLQIPPELQASDQDTLALMNRQKAEMCSPPLAGQEETCRMMEQGRQMLLDKMRGSTAAGDKPIAGGAPSGTQTVGCVTGRVERGDSTAPAILLTNGCGRPIFFNLCVNKQGDAAVSRLPGRTAADSTSRYDMWNPDRKRISYAFRWTYTDPAPVAAC